jgi:putative membrane protein
MLFIAGIAGASAMILPGVSGGYLLLVLGQYVPILTGIETLKSALEAGDAEALWQPVVGVVLPVGLGVLAGVVVVSNVLQLFLTRYRNATLGVLLGLLMGAVVGLWPFQESRPLVVGDSMKGEPVTEMNVKRLNSSVDREDLPTVTFRPTGSQIAGSLGLLAAGFLATALIARLGGRDQTLQGCERKL